MNIADRRVRYLGIALAVVGALLWFISGYTRELDGAPALILGVPADLLAPVVFALGVVPLIASRQAAKAKAKNAPAVRDRPPS